MSDYNIGVWDVVLDLNVSDASIKEACETDAPTCTMVFQLRSNTGRDRANPHESPSCRLCDMIELYASESVGVNRIESYSD